MKGSGGILKMDGNNYGVYGVKEIKTVALCMMERGLLKLNCAW